jgi:hypothetical protein
MSYKDAYHPLVKADLKKLDKPVVEKKATTFNCWRSAKGFAYKKLDFIINYDIKYRMGRERERESY